MGHATRRATGHELRAGRYTAGEEFAHALTHGVGLLVSLVGFGVLVAAARVTEDHRQMIGAAVFGATLVLVYAASTLYHGVRSARAKHFLQRVDHGAIYLLIAGTYTPFALVSLRGAGGWLLLVVIWSLATLGVALQTPLLPAARRFSLLLYLGMGWLAVFVLVPLARALPTEGLALLILGGLVYSLGVVFYAWRRLPYNHAVWHVFVMAGSACHFSCVVGYVIPTG